MSNNEITLKIKGNLEEFYKILKEKQFKIIREFSMNDTYFILENIELDKLSTREILKNALLVREIIDKMPELKYKKTLTFKKKDIDLEGNIINQECIDCRVFDIGEAKNFIKAINYKEIMNIKENDVVYEKDEFEIAVKDIENGDNLIEVELNLENPQMNTIESLKNKLIELQIPVDFQNYFVKKAEIQLNKILKR